jgi:hypothetical protein
MYLDFLSLLISKTLTPLINASKTIRSPNHFITKIAYLLRKDCAFKETDSKHPIYDRNYRFHVNSIILNSLDD